MQLEANAEILYGDMDCKYRIEKFVKSFKKCEYFTMFM